MNMLLAIMLAPRTLHYDVPPALFPLLWFALLGLVILVLLAAARQRRRRREGLEQFAMETGFQFSEKPEAALSRLLAGIQLAPGISLRAGYRNVLQGSAGGGEAIIADRTAGSGKSQSTSTILAFRFATALPSFVLYPENALVRLVEKFGYSDIDFEGAPDFSRRFFLHGEDPAAVRALFKPEVTQAFESLDPANRFSVSAAGPWLVVYRLNRLIPPSELRDFLQQAELLVNAFRRSQSSGVFA